MTEEAQNITPNEAINIYYSLKNKYETMYNEKYVKPILKSNKTNKEKRVEYSRLPKNECVNCKRNVGTTFSIYLDVKESLRKYVVKCGDLADPCPLDLQIQTSFREQFSKAINDELKKVETIKLKIIKEKNNALFFNKKVLEAFESLTQELKGVTQIAGYLIESNILKNENPEKAILLKKTIDEFSKGLLVPFKKLINEYMEKNEELKLNAAVHLYIDEMIPKLKEIQALKYDVTYIDYDEESGINYLIQYPHSQQNTEFTVESDDKVIKYVKGLKKTKKAKTIKAQDSNNNNNKPKNKTRKLKPNIEFVIEGENDEEQPNAAPTLVNKESSAGLEGVPNFDAPSGVVWNNEKYNTLWSRIPKVLKEFLAKDEEWLQEYMENCIKARQSGKRCELILPKRTKMPPEVKLDDTYEPPVEIYDFGVEAINKVFNDLNKSYKDNLLKLYSEKDGVKNYNALRSTLTDILEKRLMPGGVAGYF
jgi:hypothetical protein